MTDVEIRREMRDNALLLESKASFKRDELAVTAPRNLYSRIMKPSLDIALAMLLLIILSPVMAILAVWIKLDSKGPVFFKQQRYGKDGKIFGIYKFRSMYVNTPSQARSPTSNHDPRVTRVGRFIRKTSLDEIPQVINIMRGEMSFIGPRPELLTIVEEYYTDYERMRFMVKPGITGLWQVSPFRTAYIHDNLHYDFTYIRQLSLWMDLKIIILTIKVMFFKSNTY